MIRHNWIKDVGDVLARCWVCSVFSDTEDPLGHDREECKGDVDKRIPRGAKPEPEAEERLARGPLGERTCDSCVALRKKVAELTECLNDPDLRHGPDVETLSILRQLLAATGELRLTDLHGGNVALLSAAHVNAKGYLKRVDRTETG